MNNKFYYEVMQEYKEGRAGEIAIHFQYRVASPAAYKMPFASYDSYQELSADLYSWLTMFRKLDLITDFYTYRVLEDVIIVMDTAPTTNKETYEMMIDFIERFMSAIQ